MLQALLISIALGLGGAWGWGVYQHAEGVRECREASQRAVNKSALDRARNVGDLKASAARREAELQRKLNEVKNASTPKNCGNVDMGDSLVRDLGGVHDGAVRLRADRP